MTIAIEKLAKALDLSPEELHRRSLEAFLEREIRTAQLDIADLQDRYGVSTSADLVTKIEQGQIYSHPAWEESIEWENLEAYIDRLIQLQAQVT